MEIQIQKLTKKFEKTFFNADLSTDDIESIIKSYMSEQYGLNTVDILVDFDVRHDCLFGALVRHEATEEEEINVE